MSCSLASPECPSQVCLGGQWSMSLQDKCPVFRALWSGFQLQDFADLMAIEIALHHRFYRIIHKNYWVEDLLHPRDMSQC